MTSEAAYPGEGQTMALYGKREHEPQHISGQWKEFNRKLNEIDRKHIAVNGDPTGLWKGAQTLTDEEKRRASSYYSNQKEPHNNSSSSYDSVFNVEYKTNEKLHRDDRQHRVGLDIQAEESRRSVPTRSSSMYGRRVHEPLELPNRKHVRTEMLQKGFMRSNGTGLPKSGEARCVGVIPYS